MQFLNNIAAVIAVACSLSLQASAFTASSSSNYQQAASRSSVAVSTSLHSSNNYSEEQQHHQLSSSRRSVLSKIIAAASSTTLFLPLQSAHAASPTTTPYITDLQTSLTKISEIPPLLQNAEWDRVRTILKTPPVNSLWNLGESSNTIVKLAKETGEFDLLELKDELAISLQMTDQYSYDNVFIYYQPGNGKVKTKEPLEMANKAIVQLKEVVDVASKLE
mmetsp:Transcript_18614/g.27836  ORF Transcript_18614/g.27836 Transcript_18614/m.27836 type:complete len:220 (-) Transcript_18614:244-903(-)